MEDWFVTEQLDGDTFAVSEPRHWEQPHCYLLRGKERALLLDAGLGVADLRAAAVRLTDLPLSVALTHAHWDHIGGLRQFPDFAVHGAEENWLSSAFPLPDEQVRQSLTREPCAFPPDFDPKNYRPFRGKPARLLRDGEWLDLGGRALTVLHTPGHSPGHCCFYEAERGYLFSGDLLYCGRLDAFYPTTDPWAFRASLHRVRALEIGRIFPGHRTLKVPLDLPRRAAEAFDRLAAGGMRPGLYDFEDFSVRI